MCYSESHCIVLRNPFVRVLFCLHNTLFVADFNQKYLSNTSNVKLFKRFFSISVSSLTLWSAVLRLFKFHLNQLNVPFFNFIYRLVLFDYLVKRLQWLIFWLRSCWLFSFFRAFGAESVNLYFSNLKQNSSCTHFFLY